MRDRREVVRLSKSKRSEEHQQWVEDLRSSNAAGAHGEKKYKRTEKYRKDYHDERNWE